MNDSNIYLLNRPYERLDVLRAEFFTLKRYLVLLGTTCATVLAQAIFREGCKSVAAGVNAMDLRRGINMAVEAVIGDLKSRALMISTPEEITQVIGIWNL